LFQAQRPCFVAGEHIGFCMLGTVDFDDKFLLRAGEVDNVTGDRKLSSETKPPSAGVREARSRASTRQMS
jgi:hypothetical protein